MSDDDDFGRVLTGIMNNELLIPTLHAALFTPDFQSFSIPVDGWRTHVRQGDGWFHPSQHSLWTVRQLYILLTAPQTLDEERMPLTGVLAVTAGTFWHMFLQRILLDHGILVQDEVPVEDAELNIRGHADGVLTTGEGLEIKTINGYQVEKVNSEAMLKEKKPQYWAQAQDYLMCLDLPAMRFLLINPDYPFKMSEFLVPADKAYQANRAHEYRTALDLARRYPDPAELLNPQTPIPTCCAPQSATARSCPARRACPIGRMSLKAS